jgi:hypothetical protein
MPGTFEVEMYDQAGRNMAGLVDRDGKDDNDYQIVETKWRNGRLEMRLEHGPDTGKKHTEIVLRADVWAAHEMIRAILAFAAAATIRGNTSDDERVANALGDDLFPKGAGIGDALERQRTRQTPVS